MSKKILIDNTVETLHKLPEEKIHAVSDFANFLLKKYEEEILQSGLESLVKDSSSFSYLYDEDELYTDEDLKEKF